MNRQVNCRENPREKTESQCRAADRRAAPHGAGAGGRAFGGGQQEGAAFLITLVAVVLVSLLVGLISELVHTHVQQVDRWKAYAAAHAAVERQVSIALEALLAQQASGEGSAATASFEEVPRATRTLAGPAAGAPAVPGGMQAGGSYQIVNLGGRINVNSADESLLARLPGMTPERLDALLDWRDADGRRRPSGAERSDYARGGILPWVRYRPADGLIPAIEELTLVQGWRDYARQVEPLLGVYGLYNLAVAAPDGLYNVFVRAGIASATARRAVEQIEQVRSELRELRAPGGASGSDWPPTDSTGPPLAEGPGSPSGGGAVPAKPLELADWQFRITALSVSDWERAAPFVTVRGTMDVNSARLTVLQAVIAAAGVERGLALRLEEARKGRPFANDGEVAQLVGSENWARLRDYLTVGSRFFRVDATGWAGVEGGAGPAEGAGAGTDHRVEWVRIWADVELVATDAGGSPGSGDGGAGGQTVVRWAPGGAAKERWQAVVLRWQERRGAGLETGIEGVGQ
ncbi:MAG: general secretion pathway protein GspK [Firmicutes bacterium]|nr:general secretion pathway protein GspK [Bacillota bacterium]